ncbi:hypothetical protein EV122DRAFT_285672 [Schizophyllum commune]
MREGRSAAERRCATHSRRRNPCESTSNAPNAAPQVLVERHGCRVREGGEAERRHCARHFFNTSNLQKYAKSTSITPRPAPVPLADRRDSSFEDADTKHFLGAPNGGKIANRREMRQGPRRCLSLTASTRAPDQVRGVEDLRDQQRGALPGFRQQGFLDSFQDRKICKSTSNGPRSAPQVHVDVRDCREMGGGGAKRRLDRHVFPTSSAFCTPSVPQAARIPECPIHLRVVLRHVVVLPHEQPSDSRLDLLPSLLSSYAAPSRSSPTIWRDFSKIIPALKQRIDVPRERITPGS